MIGLKKMTKDEILRTIENFQKDRDAAYRRVQDFSKADAIATDKAMIRMHNINLEVRQCFHELERRKQ